ncbi:MAG: DUF2254 domain-containing protein [Bacteroidetes bacterium]|nr:DUF2254 domain-containing protein [Bacteroidota bacterium]MBU1373867.1 DUF2254 domain-containing protein [Bacteroidota bacterium]MBU1483974.1 DUF2254 domain-containing protein [Bacteroidota bacterium]MBU1760020.1 DUF2254 domain-containing protein [Bacteroidota bacterium]MBU2268171.1 DUF2254 domain-containing protein [Bacteroidota bacterium]
MFSRIKVWFQIRYQKIINSISFYPALIGLLFLIVAIFMLGLDFSIQGKNIKSSVSWLNIKDASTARSIISAIAAGIISLTVFSFSMVMIVLNQAASQMSNRVLDKLIGNRFQQIVLGIYIGTIVYAFFLLSTIRDIDSGLYIPSLSIYLLIVFTIFDIFLFIYFLHYITQSVKYEVIIRRIFDNTLEVMKSNCLKTEESSTEIKIENGIKIFSHKSGIYERCEENGIIRFCKENNCLVHVIPTPGTTLLKGSPIAEISKVLHEDLNKELLNYLYIHESESIEENYFYGFRQLTEVAIKALSPGINDPATAIISLRSLFELYTFRIQHFPKTILRDKSSKAFVILSELTFENIFLDTIIPIWNYGKDDRMIQQKMQLLLSQLATNHPNVTVEKLLNKVKEYSKNNEFIL